MTLLQCSKCCENAVKYLPGLPVTDDQLPLASANGHQTVHSLDTSLHGLSHRDTGDDTRGLQTHTPTGFGAQGTLREEGRKKNKKQKKNQ